MSDGPKERPPDAGLPNITEDGDNPGWRIRVGVSRHDVQALAAAAEQGTWFESEDEMRACIRRHVERRPEDTSAH